MKPQNKTEKSQQEENTKPVTELTQEDLRWITGGEGEGEHVTNRTFTVFVE
jgi:hypothetical protein